MITNPDVLYRAKNEEDKLVIEIMQYVRDMVGLPYKEKEKNGNGRSPTTKTKTAEKSGQPKT